MTNEKNIILNSLKESLLLIRKNKLAVLVLFVLQIFFFALFTYVSMNYQSKMVENAQAISDFMEQQQIDESKIAAGIMEQKDILAEFSVLTSNFSELLRNFRLYLFYSFILMLVFASASWALTDKIVRKADSKRLAYVFSRNLIVLFFCLGAIFLFFLSLINLSLSQIAGQSAKLLAKYAIFLAFSAITLYFMFIALASRDKSDLKELLKKTVDAGIKKAHYFIAVYMISLLLFGISAYLLLVFIERNIVVSILSILMLVFSFVFGRIFVAKTAEKLIG